MSNRVAIVTPTFRGDLSRFSLLCDSIDSYAQGYSHHYVLVGDDDAKYFKPFQGAKRTVITDADLIPRWFVRVPWYRTRRKMRVWLSPVAAPVNGWHMQQLAKISMAMHMPEERCCIVDSDTAFFKKVDLPAFAGGLTSPLYARRGSVEAASQPQAEWVANAHRLLGLGEPQFPADDFVGHTIVWNRQTVRDLVRRMEGVAGMAWQMALLRANAFSEYMLYGHFVINTPAERAAHVTLTDSPAISYWDKTARDRGSLAHAIREAPTSKFAICVQSSGYTDIADIRGAIYSGRAAPPP